MKIGILTFHRSRNYGAVLQAYCLVKTLEKLGHEAEVVDYSCVKIEDGLKLWNKSKNLVYSTKQFIFRLQKKLMFDKFIKNNLPTSSEKNIDKNNVTNVCNKYDCMIVGSDQIWNEKITDNDSTYFLSYIDGKVKKISYSASAGDIFTINDKNIDSIKTFSAVSVRENMLKNYLENEHIEAVVCCDPTLLYDATKLASKRLIKEKYLFLYLLWPSAKLEKIANDYAKEHNLTVISSKNCVEFFKKCKVEDYLSWFKHSEAVITNSFHATVFALKFKKPLLVNEHKKTGEKNTRVIELLSDLNCENCIIDENLVKDVVKFPNMDYKYIDKKMQEKADLSINWLENQL